MNPSKSPPAEILDIAGSEVRISNPDKVVFPGPGLTKLDLVNYYLAVAEGGPYAVPAAVRWCSSAFPRHRRRTVLPEARP